MGGRALPVRRDGRYPVQPNQVCRDQAHRRCGDIGLCGEDHQERHEAPADWAESQGEGSHQSPAWCHGLQCCQRTARVGEPEGCHVHWLMGILLLLLLLLLLYTKAVVFIGLNWSNWACVQKLLYFCIIIVFEINESTTQKK